VGVCPVPERGPEIRSRILEVRGQRVLLDEDLADLYGVSTRRVNEAVRRNPTRFPDDFMITLTRKELGDLILRSPVANPISRGGRRTLPRAFTQEGVAMLSSVPHSPRAVAVNVEIMRAFSDCAAFTVNMRNSRGAWTNSSCVTTISSRRCSTRSGH